jgi:hypothetical protein
MPLLFMHALECVNTSNKVQVDYGELKSNGTHEILVCASDSVLFGEKNFGEKNFGEKNTQNFNNMKC